MIKGIWSFRQFSREIHSYIEIYLSILRLTTRSCNVLKYIRKSKLKNWLSA